MLSSNIFYFICIEMRELKFHCNFFPVSRKSVLFFYVVFRSGRSFSFHIGVKGQCLEFAKFWAKIPRKAGKIFSPNRNGSTLQNREEHVTTFAY